MPVSLVIGGLIVVMIDCLPRQDNKLNIQRCCCCCRLGIYTTHFLVQTAAGSRYCGVKRPPVTVASSGGSIAVRLKTAIQLNRQTTRLLSKARLPVFSANYVMYKASAGKAAFN